MNRILVVDNEPDLRNTLTKPFSASEVLELPSRMRSEGLSITPSRKRGPLGAD